mgnify:CR=1 FL=1
MDNGEIYNKRDQLLLEIHSMVKVSQEKMENLEEDFKLHEKFDVERFGDINRKLSKGVWIAIIVLIVVIANGGMSFLKMIINKIGG